MEVYEKSLHFSEKLLLEKTCAEQNFAVYDESIKDKSEPSQSECPLKQKDIRW